MVVVVDGIIVGAGVVVVGVVVAQRSRQERGTDTNAKTNGGMQSGAKRCKAVQSGAKRCKAVRSGAKRCKAVQSGAKREEPSATIFDLPHYAFAAWIVVEWQESSQISSSVARLSLQQSLRPAFRARLARPSGGCKQRGRDDRAVGANKGGGTKHRRKDALKVLLVQMSL